MDILLTLCVLSQKKCDDYTQQLLASNLPKFTQHEIIDLLRTAVEQTQQAKTMGWL